VTTTFPTPEDLRAIDDPQERARVAGELAAAGRAAVPVRDDAVMELLRLGELRPFEIGRLAVIGNPQMTRYTKRLEESRGALLA
jgi:hypothetical protein